MATWLIWISFLPASSPPPNPACRAQRAWGNRQKLGRTPQPRHVLIVRSSLWHLFRSGKLLISEARAAANGPDYTGESSDITTKVRHGRLAMGLLQRDVPLLCIERLPLPAPGCVRACACCLQVLVRTLRTTAKRYTANSFL